ncbi:hypothetical protein Tco_1569894, partial [Tanacetum coccineum]
QQLSDASIEIKAYTQGLRKVEAPLVAHHQGQLWYTEKIMFMKIDLDDKTDVLTYHKKLLAEAQKEKEDLKAKVEKWHNSSKNLGKLLNTQMSANDKFGLGYGDHRYDGILSYENEVLQSVFMNKERNYMPSGPDVEIDYSQFTYGPKQSQPSESKTQTSDFDTSESECSVETHESLPEPTVIEPKVVDQPKFRPAMFFHKLIPPYSRPFKRTTVLSDRFSKQKVNTAKENAVSTVGERETAVKPQQVVIGDHKDQLVTKSPNNGCLKNKEYVNSGWFQHMTGNKAYLAEFQDFNGGPVAFGGSKGYITGKGKVKTGKLDFEDVCFVKDL